MNSRTLHRKFHKNQKYKAMNKKETSDKPLFSATIGEVCEALRSTFESVVLGNERDGASERTYLYGLKELAKFLGCSLSTAARLRKSGILEAATYRTDRILMFDKEMVLALLQVSKHKCRGPRGGYKLGCSA